MICSVFAEKIQALGLRWWQNQRTNSRWNGIKWVQRVGLQSSYLSQFRSWSQSHVWGCCAPAFSILKRYSFALKSYGYHEEKKRRCQQHHGRLCSLKYLLQEVRNIIWLDKCFLVIPKEYLKCVVQKSIIQSFRSN